MKSNIGRTFGLAMTAMELIVVLSIIAILTAVLVPTLSNYLPSIQLNGSARTLASSLREAQEKAISEQNQYLIRFSPGATPPNYQLIRIYNSVEEQVRQVNLPSNVSLAIEGTITANQVVFSPDGGPSSSGQITLSINGSNKIVSVSPAGFIKIEQ